MEKSLGLIEISGVTAAVDALDIMCKSADVTLVSWERKLGGRLVTLMIEGSVSAVNAAVENEKKKKPQTPDNSPSLFSDMGENRQIQ